MKELRVKFYRLDIFKSCFNDKDFINENSDIIVAIENDCIVLKDSVIDNTEQLARLNILTFLKDKIEGIDLIENKRVNVTHKDDVIPNELVVHVQNKGHRLICEIINVKTVKA